ncbi:MAG: 2-isopropylmalate synthase [candidate division Zixibacteria bacterium]|nr:2-isopropylmalate synthase [candidate division Zixibacteria bacterium]
MATPKEEDLIYDWNTHQGEIALSHKRVELDDETLRDGLQNPSVTDPPVEKKIELLRLMAALGIDAVNLGLPGAGPRARADMTRMAMVIRDEKLGLFPNAAVRTVKADITPLIEIVQATGLPIEAAAFIGSSPIRQYAEDWTIDHILKLSVEAIQYAVENGLPVMYVTEDTTRSRPEDIRRLYTAAIEAGAKRICIADTTGHAMPYGVRNLVAFVRQVVADTGEDVKIDWHGHSDRGLSIINALAAMKAGADRVHATGLGIGERVGNTPMDLLLVNMKLDGLTDRDLTRLAEYTRMVSDICEVPLWHNYPVFGRDAFRTATGVHAAAIIKAKNKGQDWLADRVYSGVPAGTFGMKQKIEIGFMSGVSNIVYWLNENGIEPEKKLVDEIFTAAKQHSRLLTDDDVWNIVKYYRFEKGGPVTDTLDEWKQRIKRP